MSLRSLNSRSGHLLRIASFIVACISVIYGANGSIAAEPDAFTKSVAPILQSRCVSCHNSVDRKGAFSLQKRDEVLDSGFVEPGQPDDSELLKVLVSHNGKKPAMPKSGEPLKDAEVAAIRDWIKSGAKWPDGFTIKEPVVDNADWWSFKPMKKPDVSRLSSQIANQKSPIKNPIDAFVLKTLAEQKLTPSKPADPRVLIRRLYFDLIGLPPTPEEVEAFVKESQLEPAGTQPSVYERLVDRLLASQHYGERWARHWLDVVKYADTCGYDKDKLRPNAWPYRDYVIKSFNDDKPYGRFVQEQLAGDVFFPGKADGILGLGFIAAGPWDWIGHAEVPESKIDGKVARHTDRDEMVSNTLNTFCSVTIQCAQCHNHKFDPFTQEHYYNLQSVFAAVDRAERPYDLDPQIEKQRLQLADQLKAARAALTVLNAAIQKEGGPELVALEKQIAELQPKASPAAKRPEFGYHSGIAPKQDVEKWVQIDLGREVDISKIVLRPCHDEFNNIGAGFGFPVRFKVSGGLSAAELSATDLSATDPKLLHDATQKDVPNPGLVPYEVAVARPKARFIRITATKLAPRQNDFILALAEMQVLDAVGNNVALKSAVTSLDSIEAPDRWRMSNLTDGIWASAGDEAAIKQLAEARKQRQAILDRITTAERTAERERLNKEIATSENQLTALPSGKLVYAAATHFAPIAAFNPTNGKPRAIHLLHRGNVTQPLAPSVPGTLPIALSSDSDLSPAGHFNLKPDHTEGDRRAALAQWITRPDHPLTWRSIVNRVWQHHFGRGLVETPNDFGRMGKLPTHPELLDWLAIEFRDNGQSIKKLHKLIVTSATYQQSSAHEAANSTIDSDNRFLWRMNRRRLEAEEIRDAMLAVSGKLDPKMGGPGYYLFVLERPEHSPHYEYHKFNPDDAASHRRSIYRFIVRSQPDPYMTTLDCADSSQSTPQRNETLTSLQALSLLNNGFSLAMSKHFASKLTTESSSPPEQVARAFNRISGRSPTEAELTDLTAYAQKHGLTNLCRVLFNLSEFVYVD